jgi:hypothetical protein
MASVANGIPSTTNENRPGALGDATIAVTTSTSLLSGLMEAYVENSTRCLKDYERFAAPNDRARAPAEAKIAGK